MHLDDQIIKDFVQYTYHVASSIPFQSQTAKSVHVVAPEKQLDLERIVQQKQKASAKPGSANSVLDKTRAMLTKHFIALRKQTVY